MSKTDKTRPWWVRVADKPLYTCVPVHRHENGQCDLPASPASPDAQGWHPTSCRWVPSHGFHHGKGGRCPCWGCRNKWDVGPRARRQRRASKQAVRVESARYRYGLGEEAVDWQSGSEAG